MVCQVPVEEGDAGRAGGVLEAMCVYILCSTYTLCSPLQPALAADERRTTPFSHIWTRSVHCLQSAGQVGASQLEVCGQHPLVCTCQPLKHVWDVGVLTCSCSHGVHVRCQRRDVYMAGAPGAGTGLY